MGFIEDKHSIVQQVSLFEVLGDLPENKIVSNMTQPHFPIPLTRALNLICNKVYVFKLIKT